jgi:hypothetical protein
MYSNENNYSKEQIPTKHKNDYSYGIVIPFRESIPQTKRGLNLIYFVLHFWDVS